jgi:pimeloyl-ACP methyl ester carboxylesterase
MAVDPPRQPTLVLVAEHDQFCPPSVVEPIIATWPDTTMEVIASADHFLSGRAQGAAESAAAWLSRE